VISKETLIEDLVREYPETIKVFTKHKMPCIICGEPLWGSVEENAIRYNVNLEELLKDLEEAIKK
jgi:hybrid cluster-associated redox disulfide protein